MQEVHIGSAEITINAALGLLTARVMIELEKNGGLVTADWLIAKAQEIEKMPTISGIIPGIWSLTLESAADHFEWFRDGVDPIMDRSDYMAAMAMLSQPASLSPAEVTRLCALEVKR